jgi:hypothetical protein
VETWKRAEIEPHKARGFYLTMKAMEAVIEGTIQSDGTLVLDEPTKLPPGRVRVIVQALPELPEGDPFWEMMKSIWAAQKARGHVARTAAEVEAERERNRNAWAERQQAIERTQEESRRLREQRS